MALATLTVDFLARLGNLESAVGRTSTITRAQARIMERAYDGVSASVRNLGGIIAGAFSGAALSTGFRSVVDGLDALNDASDATGISVERLSGLQNFIAGFGGELQQVTSLVLVMNRALSRADDDDSKGVSKALAAIGLEAESLRRLEPDVALLKIAQALDRFQDGGDKTRVIQAIFKDAQAAAPVLKDLASAGQLNATVTAEQAEAAERFNKQLAAFQVGVVNASRDVVTALLPALEQIGIKSEAARVANASLLEQIRAGFRGDQGTDQLKDRIAEIDAELAKLDARRRAPGSIFKGGLFGLANDIDESRLINERIALIEKLNRAQAQAPASAPSVGATKPAINFAGVLGAGSQSKGATTGKSQADFIEEFNISQLKDAAREFDAVKKKRIEGERAAAEATVDSAIAVDDLVQKYRDLADPTAVYRRQIEEITALEATGRLTAEEAFNARLRLIEQETGALDGRNEKVKEGTTFARDFGLTTSSAFEAAITGAKGAGEAVRALSRDLALVFTRNLITEPLGTAASDFVKSFKFNDLFKNLFGGGRAIGGPVQAGRLYEVNEQDGPGELLTAGGRTYLMANQSGVVTPTRASSTRQSGEGGMTVVVYQTNSFQGSADRSTLSGWAAQIQAATEQSVLASLNRNGLFARAVGRS